MFMAQYLFFDISDNKNTEYPTPTYYINNDYVNITKFTKVTSNSTQCAEKQKTSSPKE